MTKIVLKGNTGRPILVDVRTAKGASSKSPLVVFVHGFKGFKDWGHFNLMADFFAEKGFAFLKFNFSHNGGTSENPIDFPDLEAFSENTFWKELQDLKAVLDALEGRHELIQGEDQFARFLEQINLNNINLIGHSRGGGIAILSAFRDLRIKKVISWAGVGDFKKYIPTGDQLKIWKERGVVYIENKRTLQQMPMKYDFVESLIEHEKELDIPLAVKNIQQDLLLIHGDADQVVEVSEARQLQKLNPKVQLIVIPNGDHVFGAKHPFAGTELPGDTKRVIEESIQFLQNA